MTPMAEPLPWKMIVRMLGADEDPDEKMPGEWDWRFVTDDIGGMTQALQTTSHYPVILN